MVFYWTLVVRQILRRFDSEPFRRPPPVPPLPGDRWNNQITLSGGQEAQVALGLGLPAHISISAIPLPSFPLSPPTPHSL